MKFILSILPYLFKIIIFIEFILAIIVFYKAAITFSYGNIAEGLKFISLGMFLLTLIKFYEDYDYIFKE